LFPYLAASNHTARRSGDRVATTLSAPGQFRILVHFSRRSNDAWTGSSKQIASARRFGDVGLLIIDVARLIINDKSGN
jgi:hypothetical protein